MVEIVIVLIGWGGHWGSGCNWYGSLNKDGIDRLLLHVQL